MNSAKIWELSDRVGGIFKLTVLLQKRVQELIRGANKLVETESRDVLAIALMEVEQNKISLEMLTKEELAAGAQDAQDEMAAQRSILGDSKVSKDLGLT
jgi:DNA-directed RNA polymerase subunit K/omega